MTLRPKILFAVNFDLNSTTNGFPESYPIHSAYWSVFCIGFSTGI